MNVKDNIYRPVIAINTWCSAVAETALQGAL